MKERTEKYYRTILAIICWASLVLQCWLLIAAVQIPSMMAYLTSIGKFFSFLTIWTNIVVAFVITVPLLDKKSALSLYLSRPSIQGAVLVYILIVCLAYHFLLADLWNPKGWQKVADISLHYAVPVLYLFFWLIYVPKGFFAYNKVYTILSYPLIYLVFALGVGVATDHYSYYFLDVKTYGYPGFLKMIGILTVAYLAMGYIVAFVDRSLRPKP